MIQAVIVCIFHFFATLQNKNWLVDCPPHLCDAITNRQSLHSISLMLVTSFNANHHLSLNSNESVLSLILTKPSSRSTSWARFIFQSYWSWGWGGGRNTLLCDVWEGIHKQHHCQLIWKFWNLELIWCLMVRVQITMNATHLISPSFMVLAKNLKNAPKSWGGSRKC